MALVINDRVKETSTTEGTGTFNLGGAVTGFETFVAGIADGNTTYYAIFLQGSAEWEVGLGTVTDATPDTLARTTVITSSNSDSAVDFSAGTKDVFCTLPASKAVYLDASGDPVPAQISFKQEGTNFSNSLLVGHATSGTLDAASANTGVGIGALDALTSGDSNTGIGYNALTAANTGIQNVAIGEATLSSNTDGTGNVAVGYGAKQYAASAIGNVAVGYLALRVASGNKNIGIGYSAGDNISSGDGNVVIGNADVPSATGDDQLSISDGEDGAIVWITGDSSGTVSANGGELTTTGKAFVMGF